MLSECTIDKNQKILSLKLPDQTTLDQPRYFSAKFISHKLSVRIGFVYQVAMSFHLQTRVFRF